MIGLCGKIFLILSFLSIPATGQMLKSEMTSSPADLKEENPESSKNEKIVLPRSDKKTSATYRLTLFKHKRNREQQKQLLPNVEDALKYSEFLKQPKTGLIKLTDDMGCDSDAYVLRVDEECLKTIPGGSFYSFREKQHSSSALADIRLKDKLFITDGIFSQNILVNLGNIPLEQITINSEGMKFLTEFIPETDTKGATRQYVNLTKGIKADSFQYIKVLPAVADATYAMRLVAYRGRLMRLSRGFIYNVLSEDDRSDLIVAFRVVRKEKGAVTLLWKELERKKAPKIKASR